MVLILSWVRKWLQRRFPIPQPREISSTELNKNKPKTQKYIRCIGGNKHVPVIVQVNGKPHLDIRHGAFALVFKCVIGCNVCRKTIEWQKQVIMPSFWNELNMEKAELVPEGKFSDAVEKQQKRESNQTSRP